MDAAIPRQQRAGERKLPPRPPKSPNRSASTSRSNSPNVSPVTPLSETFTEYSSSRSANARDRLRGLKERNHHTNADSSNTSYTLHPAETSHKDARENLNSENEVGKVNGNGWQQSNGQPSENRNVAADQITERHSEESTSHHVEEKTSDESRSGKAQKEIGTENGIPTAAGTGTTLSPDKDALTAQSRSQPQDTKATQDHEPVSASTSQGNDSTNKTATSSVPTSLPPPELQGKDKAVFHSAPTSPLPGSPIASSVKYSSTIAEKQKRRRSLGQKIKDQFNGELKAMRGTLTNNDDLLLEGLAVKRGEHR